MRRFYLIFGGFLEKRAVWGGFAIWRARGPGPQWRQRPIDLRGEGPRPSARTAPWRTMAPEAHCPASQFAKDGTAFYLRDDITNCDLILISNELFDALLPHLSKPNLRARGLFPFFYPGGQFSDCGIQVIDILPYILGQVVECPPRTCTNARMMAMLAVIATSLLRRPDSMATPCSVKT